MAVATWLYKVWRNLTCSHHWVRARWDDGSYGLRCLDCMMPYARTWNQLLPAAAAAVVSPNSKATLKLESSAPIRKLANAFPAGELASAAPALRRAA